MVVFLNTAAAMESDSHPYDTNTCRGQINAENLAKQSREYIEDYAERYDISTDLPTEEIIRKIFETIGWEEEYIPILPQHSWKGDDQHVELYHRAQPPAHQSFLAHSAEAPHPAAPAAFPEPIEDTFTPSPSPEPAPDGAGWTGTDRTSMFSPAGRRPRMEFKYPPEGRPLGPDPRGRPRTGREPLTGHWLEEMLVDLESSRNELDDDLEELIANTEETSSEVFWLVSVLKKERDDMNIMFSAIEKVCGIEVLQKIKADVKKTMDSRKPPSSGTRRGPAPPHNRAYRSRDDDDDDDSDDEAKGDGQVRRYVDGKKKAILGLNPLPRSEPSSANVPTDTSGRLATSPTSKAVARASSQVSVHSTPSASSKRSIEQVDEDEDEDEVTSHSPKKAKFLHAQSQAGDDASNTVPGEGADVDDNESVVSDMSDVEVLRDDQITAIDPATYRAALERVRRYSSIEFRKNTARIAQKKIEEYHKAGITATENNSHLTPLEYNVFCYAIANGTYTFPPNASQSAANASQPSAATANADGQPSGRRRQPLVRHNVERLPFPLEGPGAGIRAASNLQQRNAEPVASSSAGPSLSAGHSAPSSHVDNTRPQRRVPASLPGPSSPGSDSDSLIVHDGDSSPRASTSQEVQPQPQPQPQPPLERRPRMRFLYPGPPVAPPPAPPVPAPAPAALASRPLQLRAPSDPRRTLYNQALISGDTDFLDRISAMTDSEVANAVGLGSGSTSQIRPSWLSAPPPPPPRRARPLTRDRNICVADPVTGRYVLQDRSMPWSNGGVGLNDDEDFAPARAAQMAEIARTIRESTGQHPVRVIEDESQFEDGDVEEDNELPF